MSDIELLATELENAEVVIDKLSTKIDEQRVVMRQALDAIADLYGYRKDIDEAIKALKKALNEH